MFSLKTTKPLALALGALLSTTLPATTEAADANPPSNGPTREKVTLFGDTHIIGTPVTGNVESIIDAIHTDMRATPSSQTHHLTAPRIGHSSAAETAVKIKDVVFDVINPKDHELANYADLHVMSSTNWANTRNFTVSVTSGSNATIIFTQGGTLIGASEISPKNVVEVRMELISTTLPVETFIGATSMLLKRIAPPTQSGQGEVITASLDYNLNLATK